ncbi:MAG: DUF5681 domain-containing protein [Gammaproteobacteria bacterium]
MNDNGPGNGANDRDNGRFKPGVSGNPNGRPANPKHYRLQARKELEIKAVALVKKAVELALEGDAAMMRMCIDKLLPNVKDEPVLLPGAKSGKINERMEALFLAVADGEMTPGEALNLSKALQGYAQAYVQTQGTPIGATITQERPGLEIVQMVPPQSDPPSGGEPNDPGAGGQTPAFKIIE